MQRLDLNSHVWDSKDLGEYHPRVHPMLAYSICSQTGCNDKQLASIFRIHERKLFEWKRKSKVFANAIQRGKDEYDTREVESALLKAAKGFTYREKKTERIFVRRKASGDNGSAKYEMVPGVKLTETTKVVSPNVRAAQWWLINRNPDRWAPPKVDVSHTERRELHIRYSVEQLKSMSEDELMVLRKMNEQLSLSQDGENDVLPDGSFSCEEPGDYDIEAEVLKRAENARCLLDRLGFGGEEAQPIRETGLADS